MREVIPPPPSLISALRYCTVTNPGHLGNLCRAHGYDPRRFREWNETQTEHPIATSAYGVWWCYCYADFAPARAWRRKRLLAEKEAMERLEETAQHHYPAVQPRLWEVA